MNDVLYLLIAVPPPISESQGAHAPPTIRKFHPVPRDLKKAPIHRFLHNLPRRLLCPVSFEAKRGPLLAFKAQTPLPLQQAPK